MYMPVLSVVFGYREFRRGQREVLEALADNDVLAVMPTGSGKSLCYVLPAMGVGRAIVVSPLIALMQDQVESQLKVGVRASYINSSLPRDEQNRRFTRFCSGAIDLLYVAPERLRNERFVSGLAASGVHLLAIDEAHCVSEWGHDFRPDYLVLGAVRERLGNPRTLALTATADPRVRAEILDRLGIRATAKQIIAPIDRPNLWFGVKYLPEEEERTRWLVENLRKRTDSTGIVYARSRKKTEELAEVLRKAGIPAEHYHAGMKTQERAAVQERFLSDQTPVVVATIAFGLGINKPDVRYVVHYNMPGSLEAYYQQAGRAGRDGEPADCVLCFGPGEWLAQQYFIQRAHPSDDQVRVFWQKWVASGEAELPQYLKPDQENQTNGEWAMALSALRASGLVDDLGRRISSDQNVPINTKVVREHEDVAYERLEAMERYAKSPRCRKVAILLYFGERPAKPCGNCDSCQNSHPAPHVRENERVKHCPAHIDGKHRYGLPASVPAQGVWVSCACGSRLFQPGVPVARGEATPEAGTLAGSRAAVPKPVALPSDPLLDRLRTWRLEFAKKEGVPAFTVFWDRTLKDLVEKQPSTKEELATIFGMGSAKIERFGQDILALIKASQSRS
jgi:ATP-dependent DNA helicase RecQ